MTEPPPKRFTREYLFFSVAAAVSVVVLALSGFLPLKYYTFLTSIFGSVLSAALIGVALVEFRYRGVRTRKNFTDFWGQRYGTAKAGSIILQSDRYADLTRDVLSYMRHKIEKLTIEQRPYYDIKLPSFDPDDLISELSQLREEDEPKGMQKKQRGFKARTWVNRCDVEGARAIRQAFTNLDFTPPDFKTSERPVDTEKIHDGGGPLIYMGLGFTGDAVDQVNERCEGFLKITKTLQGDAISIRSDLAEANLRDTLFPVPFEDALGQKFLTLFPKSLGNQEEQWRVDEWLAAHNEPNSPPTNDYAYILRDVLPGGRIFFHVAGFTEDGTWAAGQYLADNWEVLFQNYVKAKPNKGRFVTFLYGKSPFGEERTGPRQWREFREAAITPAKLKRGEAEKITGRGSTGRRGDSKCHWLQN